jgi:hypothetical protein
LSDYAQGAWLMANEPGDRMPPLAIVDDAATVVQSAGACADMILCES